jgi:hypothetical protein
MFSWHNKFHILRVLLRNQSYTIMQTIFTVDFDQVGTEADLDFFVYT